MTSTAALRRATGAAQRAAKLAYTRSPALPLFSGWNCVPCDGAALHGRDQLAAVVGGRRHVGAVGRGDRVRVHEVHVLAVGDAVEQRRAGASWRSRFQPMCGTLPRLRVEAAHPAREAGRGPRPPSPSSLSSKSSWKPRQTPSTGRPRAAMSRDHRVEAALAQGRRGHGECADPGEHHAVAPGQPLGVGADHRRRAPPARRARSTLRRLPTP